MGEAGVRFRPLTRSDFPLLRGWLEEPLVARWWNHQTTDDAIENDFGGSVDGSDQTELFVVLTADRHPFGLIQRYPIAAYPEYVDELAPVVEVPDGALSPDPPAGFPGFRRSGYGSWCRRVACRSSRSDCPGLPLRSAVGP